MQAALQRLRAWRPRPAGAELLVELLAQPRQLVRVAELLGVHHLVELGGEGVVAAASSVCGTPCAAGAARASRRPRRRRLLLGFLDLLLGGLALHGLRLGAEHAFLVLRLGLALAGLVLLRRVLALLLAVLLVLRLGLHLRFGEVEGGEQAAGGAGEAVLAVGVAGHLGQRGVGLLAQGVAPQVEHAVRASGAAGR
jgi:hypothetical protein